jgi:hypothetical protein
MSYKLVDKVLEARLPLTVNEKLVLLYYARHAHNDTHITYPSQVGIMAKSRIKRRNTMSKIMDKLTKLGLLIPTGKKWGATQQVVEYRLMVSKIDELNSIESDTVSNEDKGIENDTVLTPNCIESDTLKRIESDTLKRIEKRTQNLSVESINESKKHISTSDSYKLPPCPYDKVLELWHTTLPTLSKVVAFTDKRKKKLQKSWREVSTESKWESEEQGLEWFEHYFSYYKSSDFLMGRTDNNGRHWQANFEWAITHENLVKVWEDKYHQKAKPKPIQYF